MNPLIHEFLLAIIRKFITIAATWLVTEGFIGENDVEKYVAGFALMAVSLIWSLWSRYKDRINFLAALDAQPGTDEKEVKMKAKQFPPHSLVILLAAGLTLTSCASAPTKPVSQVAFYGGRTLEAINTLQQTVANLEAQRLIPTDAAADVMIAAYTAGETGQKLADLLQAYDAAVGAAKQGMVPDIGALVSSLDTLLLRVMKVNFGGQQQQIAQLVNNVLLIVNQLRAAVPGLMKTPTTGGMIGFRQPVSLPQPAS